MVERYRRSVGEHGGGGYASAPHVVSSGFGEGVKEIGGAGARLALVLKDRNDKWDAARVMEAQNEFNRAMTDWLDNPETGQTVTRKFAASRGLTDETDAYAYEAAKKILGTLDNNEQRRAFEQIAARAKLPYWKQASGHEAKEFEAYRAQVFNNTLSQGRQAVMSAPDDEFAFEQAAAFGAGAIRAQYAGADEKVVNAAVEEYKSGLEGARLGRMIEADPMSAEAWFKENKERFTAEDRAKAETVLEKATRLYKTQIAVDSLIQQFPPEKEREALKYIRANFSGEEEERIASAYKMRVNEVEVKRGNAEAGIRKTQNDNFDVLKREYWGKGNVPPPEMLGDMWDDNRINSRQYEEALKWNRTFAEKARTREYLQKTDTEFNRAAPEVQEQMILRRMGTSPEEYKNNVAAIASGVLDGSMTEGKIDGYENSGYITKYDAEAFKKKLKSIPRERQDFTKRQGVALQNDIKEILGTGYDDRSLIASNARLIFDRYVDDLETDSPTYSRDVREARKNVIVDIIADKKITLGSAGMFGWYSPTPYGERYNKILGGLNWEIEKDEPEDGDIGAVLSEWVKGQAK